MNPAIVTFGELLLRLDAVGQRRLVQAEGLQVSYTGGEANVAVALSQWGFSTRIVSRVPSHAIGDACLNAFRRYGVDTSHVVRGGERLGILFVEGGAGPRSPRVIYDRHHTAFRECKPDLFDWESIFEGAGWFHVTGTAPALSESVRQTLREAMAAARAREIPISFDCGYRSALWSVEEAAEHLPPFVRESDVFFGSESDAHNFLGIEDSGEDCLRALLKRYGLQMVAFTQRGSAAEGVPTYAATLATPQEIVAGPTCALTVVDRIGAGDAFAAGVIRGRLTGCTLSETNDFATAAAVLAHTIPGDFAVMAESEVQQLVAGQDSARGWR